MPLNLDSLSDSIDALRDSLEATLEMENAIDQKTRKTLRSGVIQNFEVAFELSWKMMQRWLKENSTPEDAENPRTRKELFRLAAAKGLIPDPVPWFTYAEARNLSSHTYDEEKAVSVYETARKYLKDGESLLDSLKKRND